MQVRQFCNDWFTVDGEGIHSKVVSPTSLNFTVGEKQRIEDARKKGETGMMFNHFEWDGWSLRRKRYR